MLCLAYFCFVQEFLPDYNCLDEAHMSLINVEAKQKSYWLVSTETSADKLRLEGIPMDQ